jgi:hypothetical protein
MEKEGIFEVREYIGEQDEHVLSQEVVDISRELDFFEQLAKQKQQATKEIGKEPISSNTGASLNPFSSQTGDAGEADFIRELSLLADEAEQRKVGEENGEEKSGEEDILQVLERLENGARPRRASDDKGISGWKKGFLTKS